MASPPPDRRETEMSGRRNYDPPMISMQEYIDTRFAATEAVVASQLQVVRAEVAQARAESTKDHAEVKVSLDTLSTEVATLKKHDDRTEAATAARVQIAKLVVTGLTVLGVALGILATLVSLI